MRKMYVYIVECRDKSYYVGVTNDIDRRVQEHNEGVNSGCFTYLRRPVRLRFYESFPGPRQAIEFEKQIKGWSRKKKEALIAGHWDLLPQLAQCENKTSHRNYQRTKERNDIT